MPTVRDAAFDVLRRLGGTTFFSNPGSTEIPLLTDLPPDLTFTLALHEGSVVGMATGWALAREQPAVVILHTTAGLGNAVGALATARVNRAPLVVLVGQQDRRHLGYEPSLTGELLDRLAGDYPVWTACPLALRTSRRCWPGRGARPNSTADPRWWSYRWTTGRPQADADQEIAAPARVLRATAVEPAIIAELADLLTAASTPALVVGAGADDPTAWRALQDLAERLDCPVWQEAFGGRAGFPQDHPLFAGHLPAARTGLRQALAGHDMILVVGAPVFRQYHFDDGRLTEPGTRIALISDDPDEINRSPVELAVLAHPAAACTALADHLRPRLAVSRPPCTADRAGSGPADGRLEPAQVFVALAERIPHDAVLVEESPSSLPNCRAWCPPRSRSASSAPRWAGSVLGCRGHRRTDGPA